MLRMLRKRAAPMPGAACHRLVSQRLCLQREGRGARLRAPSPSKISHTSGNDFFSSIHSPPRTPHVYLTHTSCHQQENRTVMPLMSWMLLRVIRYRSDFRASSTPREARTPISPSHPRDHHASSLRHTRPNRSLLQSYQAI